MQVLDGHVFLLEERQTEPAVCAVRIPETLYPIIHNTAAPENNLVASAIQGGDAIQISHQTRFSKRWRSQAGNRASRGLNLLSISEQANELQQRRIQIRSFIDPLTLLQPQGDALAALPSEVPWVEQREHLLKTNGLVFTFCLGRYGMRPLWMEEDENNQLSLFGLASSRGDPKLLSIPEQVDLKNCRFIDWDDAEGVLCTLDQDTVWILEFAA